MRLSLGEALALAGYAALFGFIAGFAFTVVVVWVEMLP